MKHVFLASLGGSPQVITETLWALMNPQKLIDPKNRNRKPVAPEVVHLVTTSFYNERLFLSVDDKNRKIEQKIGALYSQYGHRTPIIVFDPVQNEEGTESISDIRDQDENVLYANHVTTKLKAYADRPDNVIHMSLAGGRKTMSSYDHSAMMFFGRANDELSHVLVKPQALEGSPDFWWPDQEESTVTVRGIEFLTSSELAQVDLIDVPFVRLHVRLPKGPPAEALDYNSLVEFVEFEKQGEPIVVNAIDCTITIGSDVVKLAPQPFALFSLLAISKKGAWRGVGPEDEGQGPNAAGWIRLSDIRFGLEKDNRTIRTTRAFHVLELLLTRRPDGLKHRDNGLIQKVRKEPLGSSGDDATESDRSRIRIDLKQKVKSPFILEYVLPKVYGLKGVDHFLGLDIPAHRIRLVGFTDSELETDHLSEF
ncbi:MAG: TIGR02584 family CRISPR-associated protein [Marinosulfonomonas sp.]|nr:TIGR02584 family CRISPR-associated protein [Marinosulfonomonas sp.]